MSNRYTRTVFERFCENVDIDGEHFLWIGPMFRLGYGQLKVKRKNVSAHRISWTLFNGEIPEDMDVLHNCDVRNCTRPDHLFLGTQKDNMADASAKGRLYGRRPRGKAKERAI